MVSVTWDASLRDRKVGGSSRGGVVDLRARAGIVVELRIVGTASVDRSVEVGAVEGGRWRGCELGDGAGEHGGADWLRDAIG